MKQIQVEHCHRAGGLTITVRSPGATWSAFDRLTGGSTVSGVDGFPTRPLVMDDGVGMAQEPQLAPYPDAAMGHQESCTVLGSARHRDRNYGLRRHLDLRLERSIVGDEPRSLATALSIHSRGELGVPTQTNVQRHSFRTRSRRFRDAFRKFDNVVAAG